MPPRASHPSVRQKKGAKATARELVAGPLVKPPTPVRYEKDRETGIRLEKEWHPAAVRNWNIRWQSPVAAEFIDVDVVALERLLRLETEQYEEHESGGKARVTVAVEIRQLEENLGLSLTKRYALDWTVARTDESRARTDGGTPAADYVDADSFDMADEVPALVEKALS